MLTEEMIDLTDNSSIDSPGYLINYFTIKNLNISILLESIELSFYETRSKRSAEAYRIEICHSSRDSLQILTDMTPDHHRTRETQGEIINK